MIAIITKLYNVVLDTGQIPESWCIGMIRPLYKGKGDVKDPDNYRGITILSCLGKLFTSVINNRLTDYIESVGIIGEEQAGFRQGYSTIDHMFVLNSILEIYLHKKKRVYCAFVDYKKAFDLIDRTSIWMKVISSNINGKLFTVIYNMYSNAKSCAKLSGGQSSDYFMCNIGVRQGENLSPLLFAIYLNDFEFCLSKCYKGLQELSNMSLSNEDVEIFLKLYVLLYADDTIIMAENENDLQLALNATVMYCNQWHLTVNTSKTKVVIFSRGKIRNKPVFTFGENPLEIVFDYTYLGTTFNYNNSYKRAISKQVHVVRAKRAMYSMLVKSRKLCLPVDIQLKLFHQCITPILLYGCKVWGYENLDQIEVFHRNFLKKLLHVRNSTTNCMVYGETGETNLSCFIENRMLGYWARIVTGNQNKLSFVMYRLLRSVHGHNGFESKWLSHVKTLLDHRGFSNLWFIDFTNNNMSKIWFKIFLKLRGSDMYAQKWSSEVWDHSSCYNYRIFKQELQCENYLSILDTKDSISLIRFRCRNSNLPVSKKNT